MEAVLAEITRDLGTHRASIVTGNVDDAPPAIWHTTHSLSPGGTLVLVHQCLENGKGQMDRSPPQ